MILLLYWTDRNEKWLRIAEVIIGTGTCGTETTTVETRFTNVSRLILRTKLGLKSLVSAYINMLW